jgi:Flp pilus assembly protein TadD
MLNSKQINVDLLYLRALAIRRKVFGPESPQAVASLNDLGVGYAAEGKFPEAEQAFSNAMTIMDKQPKPNPATLAIVYTNMANLFQIEGKHKKARKMAEKARVFQEQENSPS